MLSADELHGLWIIYACSALILAMVLWRFTLWLHVWVRTTLVVCFLILLFTPKHIQHDNGEYFAPMVMSAMFKQFLES